MDCKKTGAGLDHNFGLQTFLIEGSFTTKLVATILDNYQIHFVNLFKTHLKNFRNNQDLTELLITAVTQIHVCHISHGSEIQK